MLFALVKFHIFLKVQNVQNLQRLHRRLVMMAESTLLMALICLACGYAGGHFASVVRWRAVARDVGILMDDIAAIAKRLTKRDGTDGVAAREAKKLQREQVEAALLQQAMSASGRSAPRLVSGAPGADIVSRAFAGGGKATFKVDE